MAAVGWLALVSVAGVEGVCEAVDRDLPPPCSILWVGQRRLCGL